jgi:hypothetical protein
MKGYKTTLTPRARQALKLLNVDQRGLTETPLRTDGFTPDCSPALSETGSRLYVGNPMFTREVDSRHSVSPC